MARKKPASNKQKKAALQEQRAIKRGDIPAGTAREHTNIKLKPSTSASALPSRSEALGTVDWLARKRASELQSRFTNLSKPYVEAANRRAFNVPLVRPLPSHAAVYKTPVQQEMDRGREGCGKVLRQLEGRLWCPVRPKWRHSMSKNELDRNEQVGFGNWLNEMDAVHAEYMNMPIQAEGEGEGEAMRRPSSFFERNLSVWRQLWRVTEQSQIILVMLDVRCPPVHFPASLRSYLRDLVTPVARRRKRTQAEVERVGGNDGTGIPTDPSSSSTPTPARTSTPTPPPPPPRPKGAPTGRKRVILCLTKTDLVDDQATQAWVRWCKDWWKYGYDVPAAAPVVGDDRERERGEEVGGEDEDEVEVVCVRSYADQPVEEQRTRHRHIPEIPGQALHELLQALENAHVQLRRPPESLLVQARQAPEKLDRWRRECRRDVKEVVNWAEFRQVHEVREVQGAGGHEDPSVVVDRGEETAEGGDGEDVEERERDDESAGEERDKEAETLTIGLIGQPNCGKSSLLNALMGRSRVRASKTPGKTKHFQSLYWSKDVRIVDCPGLVLPSLTSVEMQVQAGILPISQVSSVASCIHHIACAMPLEKALNVAPPARWVEERDRRRRIQARITTRRRDDDDLRDERGRVQSVVCETPAEGREEGVGEERWTAGDILQGWAEYRGYVTAKAGRPDTNRAGNEILRTVVEGRIPWRYLPSTGTLTDTDAKLEQLVGSDGIWLPHQTEMAASLVSHEDERIVSSEEDDDEDSGDHEGQKQVEEDSDSGLDTEEEAEERRPLGLGGKSRFAALSLGVEEGVSDNEDEGDEESVVSE